MSLNLDIIATDIKLETKRLLLRKPKSEDVDDLFRYASVDDVTRFTRFTSHKSKEETKMFLLTTKQQHQNKTSLVLVLEHLQDKKVIGAISFQNISSDDERTELGYALSREYWSQGIMSEALEKMIEFGFKKIKFNRIESFSNIENIRSIRLLKTFMQKEGILREREQRKGRFCTFSIFSVLRREYILTKSVWKQTK